VLVGVIVVPPELNAPAVEPPVEEMTGGSDDSDGIPMVLRMGSKVPVLAVASGPYVNGRPKMAHISATAEKVAAQGQYLYKLEESRTRNDGSLVSGLAHMTPPSHYKRHTRNSSCG
jgi:hypothetical protein